MSQDFIDLIKLLQDKIYMMNYHNCPSWVESYSKSVILFESQSKDRPDKYQTHLELNKLYNGFLEIYNGILPEVIINDLVIIDNNKGKKTIGLKLVSPYFINMRADLADIFGYSYYPESDLLIKKFKSTDNKETYIYESFNIVLPIISESYIKKGVSIYNVYALLNTVIHSYNINEKVFLSNSLVYETENKRGIKVKLW